MADSTRIQDIVENLADLHPALSKIAEGLAELAGSDLDPEKLSAVLYGLAGDNGAGGEGDVLTLIGCVIAQLGDPATNRGLRKLPATRGQDIRLYARNFEGFLRDYLPREEIQEVLWLADPTTA